MASGANNAFHSRIYFLCPICRKAPRTLPGHLRTDCMKGSSEQEIQDTVVQAKKEMAKFSHKGRFWEYQTLRDIFGAADPLKSMLEEMANKGLVVRNIPPHLPAPATVSLSSTKDAERNPPMDQENVNPSEEGSEEYPQSTDGPRWTSEVRVEMAQKGLYKKHSVKHPLLQGYFNYLHVDLGNMKSKQEAENVSRFMYYMDPEEPSLSFVREVEKVREHFNVLTQTQLSKQTVLNYWKSLKRFMKYTTTATSLQTKDKNLHRDCVDFINPLEGIRAGMSKRVNKELTRKRYSGYGKEKEPEDCLAILDKARADFLAVIGKLQGPGADSFIEKNDCLLVLYYLEAIVILKHLQRPGVVTNMTVEEWQERTRRQNGCSVAVKEHKTAASQVAEVLLNADHEHWFNLYYVHIRPVMLQGSRSGDDATADGHFFISSSGKQIHNPCNDLHRLHAKYNIPAVTSGDARMAFETAAKKVERNAVARLLGHTPETAEKHYRMRTPTDAFLAERVVSQLAGKTQSVSGVYTSQQDLVDERTAFDKLVQFFPVSLDGQPPKRAKRYELCGQHERHCYDRWRTEQLRLRERRVLEHFGQHQPSETGMKAWMEKQGWTSNLPKAFLMLRQWETGEQ
ncbi:unnamed protein product [Leuciscus chuanchicus]